MGVGGGGGGTLNLAMGVWSYGNKSGLKLFNSKGPISKNWYQPNALTLLNNFFFFFLRGNMSQYLNQE